MASQEQMKRLKQGVSSWNAWRNENIDIQPNLYRAKLGNVDLHGADLHDADLRDAILNGADLSEANLSNASLGGAGLLHANLSSANLSGTQFGGSLLVDANLDNASLCGAILTGVNLGGIILSGADMSNAQMGLTTIARIDLRTTRGLTEIKHVSPSYVELHTIQLPQDGSALHFLRGAGVPDEWIDFWRITVMHPIQYHSCFISYSSKDELLARRLHADLQNNGVRCWFAPEDMKIGDKIRARIDEAIHLQDKLLLLLSKHAIASTWVEDEVEAAMEKERQQQREVLFPVCLDEHVMQTGAAWAAKLRRTRHIGDFTHWTDPQAYQNAFERLLRDLKAEASKPKE